MARGLRSVDISNSPELLRLVEEVESSGESVVLRRANKDVAVLSSSPRPLRPRGKLARTKADHDAFLSSAGGWKGLIDAEKFLADNYESRARSTRPHVDL
jgi:hypothetical protein